MSASGGKAEVKNAENQDFKGPESAKSGGPEITGRESG
jgi:hypothetical protein